MPTNATTVKAEAISLAWHWQVTNIPIFNIYIPEGVKNIESKGIYIGANSDNTMKQDVIININLEANSIPSSWASDWYYLDKGTTDDTFNKTIINVRYNQTF